MVESLDYIKVIKNECIGLLAELGELQKLLPTN